MRQLLLLPLLALGACSSVFVDDREPTALDRLSVEEERVGRNLPARVYVLPTESAGILELLVAVDLSQWPAGAELQRAYLRLRIAEGLALQEDDTPRASWEPRIGRVDEAIAVRAVSGGEVTDGEVSRDPKAIFRGLLKDGEAPARERLEALAGRGVPGLLPEEAGLTVLGNLRRGSPLEVAAVKQNGPWLEVDATRQTFDGRLDGFALLRLSGPVVVNDEGQREGFWDHLAPAPHLQPHLHWVGR